MANTFKNASASFCTPLRFLTFLAHKSILLMMSYHCTLKHQSSSPLQNRNSALQISPTPRLEISLRRSSSNPRRMSTSAWECWQSTTSRSASLPSNCSQTCSQTGQVTMFGRDAFPVSAMVFAICMVWHSMAICFGRKYRAFRVCVKLSMRHVPDG